MNMTAFENAIAKRVTAEAGLSVGKVIWAKQTRARPQRPFIALDILESSNPGQGSEQRTIENPDWDSDTDTENLDALKISNIDHPELTVQLTAYSNEVTGDSRAANVLERVRVKFGSDRATADLGDIAVVNRGNVRDVSLVLENEYEGRAVLAIVFRVADENVEDAGVIEIVEVETTIDTDADTVVNNTTYT